MQQLHSTFYRIRIITVRSLKTIMTEDNKEEILEKLNMRLAIEKSLAVKQNMLKVIETN